ncbi:hypothetical protein DFH06DRAFT_14744 [Mycena polygramma]|nr:hypothetical protein DFH06DRAFT_14744 [Mycena polygramma]
MSETINFRTHSDTRSTKRFFGPRWDWSGPRRLRYIDDLERKVIKAVALEYLSLERPETSQTPESLIAFQAVLKRLFQRFRNKDEGSKRLESAVFFAQTDIRRERKAIRDHGKAAEGSVKKKKSSPPITPNDCPASENLETPSSVAGPVDKESLINTPHATDILAFLEGCDPPLPFLLPRFIEAGIDERDWLWAMKEWPKSALHDFLARNFNIREDGSVDDSHKVALQALLIHFNRYR